MLVKRFVLVIGNWCINVLEITTPFLSNGYRVGYVLAIGLFKSTFVTCPRFESQIYQVPEQFLVDIDSFVTFINVVKLILKYFSLDLDHIW